MSKEIKKLQLRQLENPMPIMDIPDTYHMNTITVLTKYKIDPEIHKYIQLQLHRMLGINYVRSYVS